MNKVLFLFLLMALSLSCSADEVTNFCKNRWVSDYSMIEYCINRQYESINNLVTLLKSYPLKSEENYINYKCRKKWTDENGLTDYNMVLFCTEKQINAYHRLNN